ncbi:MAG: sulfatase-like hydrolase/transferase [Bacteroidota bacterium]
MPNKLFAVPLLFILSLFVLLSSCENDEVPPDLPPPNILWLVLEDMSPQFIGAYGNEAANTPVIDSLIKAGIQFKAAFSTGTVCSPSRYTIITGTNTNEYATGHHRSNYPIPAAVKGFPAYLKEKGYHTSNNAKRDYNTSERWRITKESWVESSYEAGWWNRQPGQPFFSVFNFDNCHQSRTFTNPYDDYKKRILDKIPVEAVVAPADIILPTFYEDTPDLRKELSRTYNALKKTDMEVDSILNRLRVDNLLDSTIIFIYSDHGGGGLNTKSRGGALGHQVPMSVIIPPAYAHLNPPAKADLAAVPVTFEDLGPTVLSLGDTLVPDHMTGRSFFSKDILDRQYIYASSDRCGEANDLTRSVSDGTFFYTRVFMPNQAPLSWNKYFDYAKSRQLARQYAQEGKLNETQNKLFQPRPVEMLHHLNDDTWQTENLATQPAYASELTRLRNALDAELLRRKDAHFIPEYTLDSIAKDTTPFTYKSSEAYDFANIYAVAKLVNTGASAIPKQLTALKSTNPMIRYWAAMGLRSQQADDLMPHATAIIAATKAESYPPARIELAGLSYQFFGDENSRTILGEYLRSDQPALSVQAAQKIIYLPQEKAIYYLNDVRELKTQKIPGGLSESLDMYLYIFTGQVLYYAHHW